MRWTQHQFLFFRKNFKPSHHPSWPATRRSNTPIKMLEQFFLYHEILRRELNFEPIIISSPIEKKNVWRKGDQHQTKCLSPLISRKPSRFLVITTDFRTPARSRNPTKSASFNSFSTHSAQPMIFPTTKSRNMRTACGDPRLIWRSNISFGSGTYVELVNPGLLEKTQMWGDGGLAPWATWGKNGLMVY